MAKEVKQIGTQFTRALFDLATVNVATRTIDVVFATETPVLRRNWEIGLYNEVLVCNAANVRMDRLNAGAAVLDNHDASTVTKQLGVVEAAKIAGGEGRATLRFSKRDDVEKVWQDVQDGILRGVSVGYNIYEMELTEKMNETPTVRAIDWEPMEISMAPVPADYKSGTRSQSEQTHEVIINKNLNNMPETNAAAAANQSGAGEPVVVAAAAAPVAATAAVTEPVANVEEVRSAAFKASTKRSSEILHAVRAANLTADFAQTLIDDSNITVDAARAAILQKMSENMNTTNIRSAVTTAVTGADESVKTRSAIITGMGLRSGQIQEKNITPELVAGARQYRSLSLLDIAKDSLTRAGISFAGMDKMEIVGRAITSSSSDFPVLLQGVIHKTLLANYVAVADTWKRFCNTGSVSDFREHKRLRMGSFSRLDKMAENGEYKNKSIPDATQEGISANTFGNTINVSRKMIINDDLNAFSQLATMLGRAAARSIEIDAYALLASNPVMADGIALFHASHGNLIATGVAPTVLSIDAMRVLMAQQKDDSGNDFLDMRPSALLIGIHQGGTARIINSSAVDPDTANKIQRPNIVNGLFSDVIDTARITGNEYYAFANPAEQPVIEVAFLDGVQEPFMDQQEEFDVDGMKWKCRLDYGVGAVGFKGAIKNPGA